MVHSATSDHSERDSLRSVRLGHRTVRYHDLGEGPPVLLLHSIATPGVSGWLCFSKVARLLSDFYRCIIVDLPGFQVDRLAPTEDVYRIAADTSLDLMAGLGFKRFAVLANAQGSRVCIQLSRLEPAIVARMVLGAVQVSAESGAGWLRPRPSEATMLMREADADLESPEKLERLLKALVFDPDKVTEELFGSVYDLRRSLVGNSGQTQRSAIEAADALEIRELDTPALFIWGREDRLVPVEDGLAQLSKMRTADLVILRNCGHLVPFEQPSLYASHVVRFLQATPDDVI